MASSASLISQKILMLCVMCPTATPALWRGWDITLLMLVVIPLSAGITYFAFRLMEKSAARAQQAYGTANEIVLESTSAIRTIAAYSAEAIMCSKYSTALLFPLRKGVQEVTPNSTRT